MKCPKCSYLGFDTGDRCRNCGYDFSFLDSQLAEDEIELALRTANAEDETPSRWLEEVDLALGGTNDRVTEAVAESPVLDPPSRPPAIQTTSRPVATAPARSDVDPGLPLFALDRSRRDDEPLIKLPAAPRAPLSVRRTPDKPRLRAVPPRLAADAPAEPVLQFAEEPSVEVERAPKREVRRHSAPVLGGVSKPGSRLAAAVLDGLLLAGVDLAIVYFTLRIAGLSMADWRMLPPVPLIAFVLFLKFAYFCAFNAVGGQTIGKMALGIRVVTEDGESLDGAAAAQRAVAGLASAIPFGLGFLPALYGSDGRAVHDRLTGTRVVEVRPM
jgi:uncharacterized RDD family membrane protein YckC